MIRQAVRARRRETLSQMVLLSMALHLALFLSLLIIPSTPLSTASSAPASVEVMADEGTAEGEKLPTPSYAPAAEVPTEALPAAVQPPAPPDMPPPPPVPQTQITPPAPAPMPVPTAPTEVAAPPPPTPPQHAAARPAAKPAAARAVPPSRGAPAHSADGQDAASLANGANHGNGWTGKLKQWWDQHSFYPEEASQSDEGGDVKVHIVIAPDGQVTSVQVVHGSGSSVLDKAAVDVFRNARLPPFPPGTPAPPADVEVSLHYVPAHKGG